MKLFIKLMIFLVVVACAAPFILKRDDARPWMSLSDLKTPDISLPDVKPIADQISGLTDEISDKKSSEPDTVYKWKDENGVWHFADNASTASTSEAIEIDSYANLVHIERGRFHVDQTSDIEQTTRQERKIPDNKPTTLDPDSSPYRQLPELIDRAKNIEQVLKHGSLRQERSITE